MERDSSPSASGFAAGGRPRAGALVTGRVRSFDEFWPHYLREHASPLNRALHVTGATVALALAGAALARRRPGLLLLAPLAGYAPAWLGHFLVERNRPASFHHPLWSVRADLKMLSMCATGRLAGEVARCAAAAREDVGPEAHPDLPPVARHP